MGAVKQSNFKIDNRIYIVFILVVAIAIANALLSTFKINNNKNAIFEITQYTNPTLENLEEFNLLVTRSRMFISNWVYLPNNNNDKTNLVDLNSTSYPQLKAKLTALSKGWGSTENVVQVNKLFTEYEAIIREQQKIMKSLNEFDDYQDPMKKFLAEEQLESEIIPATNKIMGNLRSLISIKKQEAITMQDHMLKDNEHLLLIVFVLAIMVIVSVMVAGLYMMKRVIIPLMNVREIMLKMSEGELPEVKVESGKSALVEMKAALNQLRNGLQRTSSFAGEIGKSNFDATFQPLSENDVLGHALLEMRDKLKYAYEQDAVRNWLSEGFANISTILHRNTEDITQLSDEIICGLVTYIEGHQGVIYLVNDQTEDDAFIEPVSFFAPAHQLLDQNRIELNEGLIGQVVSTNKKIYLQNVQDNSSSLDTGISKVAICDIYIVPLYAGGNVVGAMEIKSAHTISHQKRDFIDRISEPVASNISNLKASLLTRRLLEESQLKTRELAHQDEELRQINNELVNQSRKLKQSDSELRNQQEILQGVNAELENKALLLEEKNMAIQDAHKALAFKAEQLERSSKYKSDFLANMSHELRTPLNSVLILAKILGENRTGNMTSKQVEHARVIHKSGSDLLVIINDILDLSKIEAGKLELNVEKTSIHEICNNMEQLFSEVSKEKKISFFAHTHTTLSEFIYTDRVRVEQVLKNLLSNAFKFTPQDGSIKLEVNAVENEGHFNNEKLKNTGSIICFSVSDTGIGVPEEKQKLIFEAFNQADSSITRRYGGTGLGLAICRQLSSLLGGDIVLESEEGTGSVFKFYLPVGDINSNNDLQSPASQNVQNGKVETDSSNKVLVFCSDETAMREWTIAFAPENYAVNFKTNFEFTNIDVVPSIIIIDATLSDKEYIEKVNSIRDTDQLVHVPIVCRSVSEYIPAEVKNKILLHTTAPKISKIVSEILEKIHTPEKEYAGKYTSEKQFHHSDTSHQIPQLPINTTFRLDGKKVLIADDDIRNIYSMTTIFENLGAEVICAMDGFEALDKLRENNNIDLILMDIMMPNLDGLHAIQQIRKLEYGKNIPIIAVTAKAMQGDREICIGSGANEYITKPVDVELLITQTSVLLKESL